MNVLRTAVQELVGLFVDDAWYAAAIAGWLVINAGFAALSLGDARYRAIFFAAGLIVILVSSIVKAASRL